jgi:hypothetical protein
MIYVGWNPEGHPPFATEASAWRISSLELDTWPGLLVESVVCSLKYTIRVFADAVVSQTVSGSSEIRVNLSY